MSAYNTTQFIVAEDFVPANSGFINTACLQGVFWNGLSDPDNSAGDCSDFGTEEWTLTYYRDTNPAIVRWANRMISEVLADHEAG